MSLHGRAVERDRGFRPYRCISTADWDDERTVSTPNQPPGRTTASAGVDGTRGEPSLSVVVPTLNEEEGIAACLESVLDVCNDVPATEVILVDSNSEDRTVEIASQYPVTVLQLPSEVSVTPGAGRYVGTEAASGDHVLFVDGDMVLADGWLTDARQLLAERDDVAGVGGHLNEVKSPRVESVRTLHGVMLYDADVLAEVGGFDPFLQGYEDMELGYRLRTAGYELLEVPAVVANHSRTANVSELRRRWRNGYLLGYGQALRKSWTSPRIVRDLLLGKWFQISFVSWFVLGVALAVTSLQTFAMWAAVTGTLYVADVIYEGPVDATRRFLWEGTAWTGYVRGFVRGSRDPSAFPVDSVVEVSTPTTGVTSVRESVEARQN